MATYIVGDVQGCGADLERLLEKIAFSDEDQLWLVGDLVNRGPTSLETLRLIQNLGERVVCVLGNHDLHLLALSVGARTPSKDDTLQTILDAPDCAELLTWLRQRKLAHYEHGILMVHAGVLPQWSVADTLSFAAEVEQVLQGPAYADFLRAMYGNQPAQWGPELERHERWRAIVNALTRLRFCTPSGAMDFTHTGDAKSAPAGYMPWFAVPGRATEHTTIAFGHWSTLGLRNEKNLLALDTGCVWGGKLSACRLDRDADGTFKRTIMQIPCAQYQTP